MGILGYLTAKLTGSRNLYQQQAEFWGPRRLARRIFRDIKAARREDKKWRKALKDLKEALHAANKPEVREAELKEADAKLKKFVEEIKKEIELNAKVLVGAESLLYQIKEKGIFKVIREIEKIQAQGFPESIAQELIAKLRTVQQHYEDDLQKLRTMTRREHKGRWQMSTVAIRNELMLEREMRRDARKVRSLAKHFDSTLKQLHKAEFAGRVEETQKRIDQMEDDLEKELELVMEIAEDDITVMHKLKERILDVGKLIQSSPAMPDQKNNWIRLLTQVHEFETSTLRKLRQSTRKLERREGDVEQVNVPKQGQVIQFPNQQQDQNQRRVA